MQVNLVLNGKLGQGSPHQANSFVRNAIRVVGGRMLLFKSTFLEEIKFLLHYYSLISATTQSVIAQKCDIFYILQSRDPSALDTVTKQIVFHLCKQIPFHFLLPCQALLCYTSPTPSKSAFVALICTKICVAPPPCHVQLQHRVSGVCVAWDVILFPPATLRSSDTSPQSQIANLQNQIFSSKNLTKSNFLLPRLDHLTPCHRVRL